MSQETPYRDPPADPRFICGLCWSTASSDEGGICPRCNIARLPIAEESVREDIRRRVSELRRKRRARVLGAVWTVVFVIPFLILWVFLTHPYKESCGEFLLVALGGVLSAVVGLIVSRVFLGKRRAELIRHGRYFEWECQVCGHVYDRTKVGIQVFRPGE